MAIVGLLGAPWLGVAAIEGLVAGVVRSCGSSVSRKRNRGWWAVNRKRPTMKSIRAKGVGNYGSPSVIFAAVVLLVLALVAAVVIFFVGQGSGRDEASA